MPRGDLPEVVRFEREEFLAARWTYEQGEHVATPKLPGIVLVMKPRDATVTRWTKSAGFRRVRSWPPAPVLPGMRRPPGYVVWPKHTFDPDVDDYNLYREFRRVMLDSYRRGNRIVFADEMYGISSELNLNREAVTLWTRGRSMGTGVW